MSMHAPLVELAFRFVQKFAREIVRKCFPEDEIPTYRNLGTEKRWNLEQKACFSLHD